MKKQLILGLSLKLTNKFPTIGGATESIFFKAEQILLSDTDYFEAILFLTTTQNILYYRSMMDFFFCGTHPDWKRACKEFYNNKGLALRYLIDDVQKDKMEQRIIHGLDIAITIYQQVNRRGNRNILWTEFLRRLNS